MVSRYNWIYLIVLGVGGGAEQRGCWKHRNWTFVSVVKSNFKPTFSNFAYYLVFSALSDLIRLHFAIHEVMFDI